MKAALILFMIVLLAGLACATSTDGNYTLIQFDFLGSGESTMTDGNYASFADVGEPIAHQSMTDGNYNAGVGFYGEFAVSIILAIAEVVEAAFETIVVIVPMLGGSVISIVMLIVVIGFMATILYTKNKLGKLSGDLKRSKKQEEIEDESLEEIIE